MIWTFIKSNLYILIFIVPVVAFIMNRRDVLSSFVDSLSPFFRLFVALAWVLVIGGRTFFLWVEPA